MSGEQIEEEIAVSGSLFSVSLFEEKLMKNFLLISNKLRKLEGLADLEQRNKALEKELKFLGMKVESIMEKIPKDSHSLTKIDVKSIVKEQFFEIMNTAEDKIAKTKYHTELVAELPKMKAESLHQNSKGLADRKAGSKASFTAGQALRETEKNKVPKESLEECLNDK